MRSRAEREETRPPVSDTVDLHLHGLSRAGQPATPDGSLRSSSDAGIDSVIAGTAGRPHLGTSGAGTATDKPDDPFTIVTDENGTAHVVRKPDTTVRSAIPTPKQIGDGIDAWSKVEKFTDKDYTTLSGDKLFEKNGVNVIPFEGSLSFLIPVMGGNFDVGQAIQRGVGEDPYRARRQNMLDASRDERAAALERKREVALADTRRTMTRNLARMWASIADPAARKRAAFEMWDECAETGDANTLAAAVEARAVVIEFLRGHGVMYSAPELADLNAHRHSKAAFQP